jgi:hypothetical protein
VDPGVGAQVAEQGGELLRGHVAAGLVVKRLDAHLGGVLALHAHVDRRRRVVAHQNGGQTRAHLHAGHLARHLAADARGHRLAVDDPRAHRLLSGA